MQVGVNILKIYVDENKCIACGDCKDICPKGEIIWSINKIAHASNLGYCHVCTICASRCPTGAILVDRNAPGDDKSERNNQPHEDDLIG
ncbi:MAG: ferredoxin family protein [Methanobrevibacter sp.]|nr:ferredoxin family protein [Methanobrevibacter sp.]